MLTCNVFLRPHAINVSVSNVVFLINYTNHIYTSQFFLLQYSRDVSCDACMRVRLLWNFTIHCIYRMNCCLHAVLIVLVAIINFEWTVRLSYFATSYLKYDSTGDLLSSYLSIFDKHKYKLIKLTYLCFNFITIDNGVMGPCCVFSLAHICFIKLKFNTTYKRLYSDSR